MAFAGEAEVRRWGKRSSPPRHVCPTVNNFDCALLVRDGEVKSVEKVSARGREAPCCRRRPYGSPQGLSNSGEIAKADCSRPSSEKAPHE